MANLQTIIEDPQFGQLTSEEKFKLLNQVSTDFQALPQDKKEGLIIELEQVQQPIQQSQPIQGQVQEDVYLYGEPKTAGIFEKPLDILEASYPVVGGTVGALAGVGTPASIALGGLGAGAGEALKQTQEMLRGEKPVPEFISGGKKIAGEALAGLLGGLGGEAVSAGISAIPKITKVAAPTLSKILSAIPEEQTENLINMYETGKEVLKKSFNIEKEYNQLGKQVLNNISELKKGLGAQVGQVKKILAQYENIKVPSSDLISNLQNRIKEVNIGGVNVLEPQDLKIINEVYNELSTGDVSPAKLLGLKSKIQNATTFSPNKVNLTSNSGDYILKATANELDNVLTTMYPELADVNKSYSEMADLLQYLKTNLQDKNIASTLRNLDSERYTQSGLKEALEKLDTLLPEDKQFIQKARDIRTQAEFERPFAFTKSPNRVEQQSIIEQMNLMKSLLGLGGYASGGLSGAGLGLGLATTIQSPRVQAKAIETLLKTPQLPQGVGTATGTGISPALLEILGDNQ